ncbi:hypothetical protein DRP43_02710 [candidate division TA06 bacterium]|uniref:Acyl-peptide hydrolase n=1 Tax=candidate division TA06 bacterium TaxID=2250710 RepID=A0A660SL18_UNCT6|nr:MAG: hypothetical protein DRP43_02710 [candidate division TA06 bacterium]
MKKEKVLIQDLFELKFIRSVRIKPDDNKFLYIVEGIDKKDDKYYSKIYEYDFKSKESKQLIHKKGKYFNVNYSPNGKWISFISNRDKKMKLYIMPSDGGEAEEIEFKEFYLVNYLWGKDEKNLLLTLTKKSKEEKDLEKAKKPEKKTPAVRIIDSLSYKCDGKGFLTSNKPQLYIYNIKKGKIDKQLTKKKNGILEGVLSNDSKYIYYTVFEKKDWEQNTNYIGIYKLNIKSGKEEKIDVEKGSKFALSISNDGKYLSYLGNTRVDDYTGTVNYKPFVIDLLNNSVEEILKNSDLMCIDMTVDDSGESFDSTSLKWSVRNELLFFVSDKGSCHIYCLNVSNGKIQKIFGGTGKSITFDKSKTHTIYALSNAVHPGRIIIDPGKKGETEIDPNKKYIKSHYISKPEPFRWKGYKKDIINGWILKPYGQIKGKKYPLIVEIHGGPHAQYGNSFFHEFQVLSSKGYVIFYSNPHGSSGYGEIFAKSLVARWGVPDTEDILNAIKIIKNYDYIDGNRIGVTGGSYGGFMTNWLIGHTDIFKAAVTQRSVTNLVSFFGSSDGGYYFKHEFKTTFWENIEYYLKYSPISYVKNIKTPLLIIHSENDLRAPIEQAEQLFVALKMLKRKVRFARFPEESHGLSRIGTPSRRIKRIELIVDWFNKFL